MSPKPDAASKTTQRFRSHVALATAGWKQATHEGALSGPVVWCYMFDLATKWTWLCTIDAASFAAMSVHSHNHPAEASAVHSGVADVAGKAAEGAPPGPHEGLSWEKQLGALLAMYAGTTKVWERAGRFTEGGHFVVLNYRKPGGHDGLLRPFALNAGAAVMPADELQSTIAQVIALDRERHPEWFA